MINVFVIGKKGLDSLSGLDAALYVKINAIVVGQDSGVVNDYSAQIVALAQQQNIRCFLRTNADETLLSQAQLNIAIGWRWLIALERPLVVFHDSILPKYRGFNPLVSALINGDTQIGVTALLGTDEFDKGDIIGQRILDINYPIKIEQAIDLLSKEYALLLQEVISNFDAEIPQGIPQDESKATFSLWRDEDDYRIDWSKDSTAIKRMIDAVGFPYKGAATIMDGETVRIFDATVVSDVNIVNRTPGKVLFKQPDGHVIVCGTGLLKINTFYNDNNQPIHPTKFRIRFQ